MPALERKTWDEFQDAGLVWWINRILHMFGWAIVLSVDGDKVVEAYPARCKYRGFPSDIEEDGFEKLTTHLAENVNQLKFDVFDSSEDPPPPS